MKNETKHTQGWEVKKVGAIQYVYSKEYQTNIAKVFQHSRKGITSTIAEKHAHLIATAPKMLEALKMLITSHKCQTEEVKKSSLLTAINMANEAIAKAEGRG